MEQYTHIAFLYVMSTFIVGTWLAVIIWKYKLEKIQSSVSEQRFTFSFIISFLLVAVITFLWCTNGLDSAVKAYIAIHDFSREAKNQFPILCTLLLTLVGVFLTFLILRPKMNIGKYIAYAEKSKKLVLNVHNDSWFAAHNVCAKLYECTEDNGNLLVNEIPLESSDNYKLEWKFAHDNLNAIEFNTPQCDDKELPDVLENLKKENNRYLELRITATHAVSGTTFTFSQSYDSNTILHGFYEKRKFMAIGPENTIKEYKQWRRVISCVKDIMLHLEFVTILALFIILIIAINTNDSMSDYYPATFFWLTFALYIEELGRWWVNMPYGDKVEKEYLVIKKNID